MIGDILVFAPYKYSSYCAEGHLAIIVDIGVDNDYVMIAEQNYN